MTPLNGHSNIEIVGYSGLTVDFCRKVNVKVILRGLRVFSDFEHEFRMALANNRLAPEVDVVALVTREQHTFLSSTTVREIAALGGDVELNGSTHCRSRAPTPLQRVGRRADGGADDGIAGLNYELGRMKDEMLICA